MRFGERTEGHKKGGDHFLGLCQNLMCLGVSGSNLFGFVSGLNLFGFVFGGRTERDEE